MLFDLLLFGSHAEISARAELRLLVSQVVDPFKDVNLVALKCFVVRHQDKVVIFPVLLGIFLGLRSVVVIHLLELSFLPLFDPKQFSLADFLF